jgi:hypothetical protein
MTTCRADAAQRLLRQQAKLELRIALLREALKPFTRHINAESLSEALGHIEREDLERAKEALEDSV